MIIASEERRAAIKRLRASRLESVKTFDVLCTSSLTEARFRGRDAGRHYSLHKASYSGLERLNRYFEYDPTAHPESLEALTDIMAQGGPNGAAMIQDILTETLEGQLPWPDKLYELTWLDSFVAGLIESYLELRGDVVSIEEQEAA